MLHVMKIWAHKHAIGHLNYFIIACLEFPLEAESVRIYLNVCTDVVCSQDRNDKYNTFMLDYLVYE